MSQTQLATADSEKGAVINAYESGKAILTGVAVSNSTERWVRGCLRPSKVFDLALVEQAEHVTEQELNAYTCQYWVRQSPG